QVERGGNRQLGPPNRSVSCIVSNPTRPLHPDLRSLRVVGLRPCCKPRREAPQPPLTPRSGVLTFSTVFSASCSAPPRLRVKTQASSPVIPHVRSSPLTIVSACLNSTSWDSASMPPIR